MASLISTVPSIYFEGTADADNVTVKGNHSTLSAMGGDDSISVQFGRGDYIDYWYRNSTHDGVILAGDGNDKIEVISRGSSIYGGAGNDEIRIYGTADDSYFFADGGTENDIFYISNTGTSEIAVTLTTGAGNDTIDLQPGSNYATNVTVTDFSNADVIYHEQYYFAPSGNAITYTKNNSGDIVLEFTTGPNIFITLQGITDILQVVYATYYFNDHGGVTKRTIGEIFGLLIGDEGDNQITAGTGNASLWGGVGGNDTLIGGSGQNMFWYGKTNGADVIQNAKENDTVNLYDISLSDITSVSYGEKSISLGFNTGGTLQINDTGNLSSKFMLADGTKWQFNHSTKNWQNA